jgi:hypothetical protein
MARGETTPSLFFLSYTARFGSPCPSLLWPALEATHPFFFFCPTIWPAPHTLALPGLPFSPPTRPKASHQAHQTLATDVHALVTLPRTRAQSPDERRRIDARPRLGNTLASSYTPLTPRGPARPLGSLPLAAAVPHAGLAVAAARRPSVALLRLYKATPAPTSPSHPRHHSPPPPDAPWECPRHCSGLQLGEALLPWSPSGEEGRRTFLVDANPCPSPFSSPTGRPGADPCPLPLARHAGGRRRHEVLPDARAIAAGRNQGGGAGRRQTRPRPVLRRHRPPEPLPTCSAPHR